MANHIKFRLLNNHEVAILGRNFNNAKLMKIKTFAVLMISVLTWTELRANQVQFTASAPGQVAVGQRFRVTYTVNKRPSSFEGPSSFKGFNFLGGPSQSMSSQTQWINNQMTMSESHSFSYTLEATAEGTLTIPSGRVVVDGNTYTSNQPIVVVSGQVQHQQAPSRGQPQPPGQPQQGATTQNISDEDIYVTASVSNRNPWQGERVTVTYKLYTRVGVTQYNIEKLPSFQGIWSEDVTQAGQVQVTEEVINGQRYNVATLKQFLVFSQRSGEIRIEPLTVQAFIRLAARRTDNLFDEFFGGMFGGYETIERKLRSNALVINAKALPTQNKPGSFNGSVGNFDLTATISATETKVNDPVTLRLKVSGTGNLRLVEKPDISFPLNLESFEPKVKDNIRVEASGVSGSREFEYLLVPRTGGTFEIPPVQFSFFDPGGQRYLTRTTPRLTVKVEGSPAQTSAGVGSGASQKEVQLLASDIRFIENKNFRLYPVGALFFRSTLYYFLIILPVFIFAVLLIVRRRHIKLQADTVALNNRRAEKMAKKRLKSAGVLMKQGNSNEFYDEIFRALWGYLSNKLSLPVANLNKDVVSEVFDRKGVSPELAQRFIDALNDCEFARFAPGEPIARMDETYQQAIDTIVILEKELNNKK